MPLFCYSLHHNDGLGAGFAEFGNIHPIIFNQILRFDGLNVKADDNWTFMAIVQLSLLLTIVCLLLGIFLFGAIDIIFILVTFFYD
jgi:hypothetical protein